MSEFTIHTIESAPAEVKEVLETVQKDNGGYIPNLIGLLANAPTALETYRTIRFQAFQHLYAVGAVFFVFLVSHGLYL